MDESAAGPLQGGRCPPGSLSTLVLFALRQQRTPRPPLASIVVIVLSWGGHAQFSAVHVLAFAVVVLGRVELPTSTLSV